MPSESTRIPSRRTAAADPLAAERLDARYRRKLTRYARSLLGRSHHDAEDVVQDVLLTAHREIAAGRGPEHLDAWIYRLTRNRAIDEMRRTRWGEASIDAAADDGEAMKARSVGIGGPRDGDGRATNDPAAVFHRRETLRSLVQDLSDLPTAQRDALLARVVDGDSPQESAARLGVSVEALQMLVVRGRANLVRIRELRQATGDLDTQLRLLAPPVSVIPLIGLAKLIGFGGPKVVGAVVAALAVVAAATGIEVTRTQHASAGQPAPFTLNARDEPDDYFDHRVVRGQKIPAGNAVVAVTMRFAAGPEHAKHRVATLQCPEGFRAASILNWVHPDPSMPLNFNLVDGRQAPASSGKISIEFEDKVLAKPVTERIRLLCRKPGAGGSLLLHPRQRKPGEGIGRTRHYAELFLYPGRLIVGTVPQGVVVTILRRAGDHVFVVAPQSGRGWMPTSDLYPRWTPPTKQAEGPPLFPKSELGYPYGVKGFATAASAKWLYAKGHGGNATRP